MTNLFASFRPGVLELSNGLFKEERPLAHDPSWSTPCEPVGQDSESRN